MVKSPTKKKQPEPLSVHGLLGSLSYWGTAARMVLMVVLLGCAYLLNISVQTTWQAVDMETMLLIYGLGTIVVLDTGYVMAARALKLNAVFDRWAVMLSDLLVAAFFVVPSLFLVDVHATKLRILSLIFALLIVSIRILLGFILTKRK
ncbi:MAG TPA: hypothetical protein PKD68_00965 [Candidatus Saccharibacteria bacterium]|nr:hypothetical protein [Candidatus Saccharibacteria bacterium]